MGSIIICKYMPAEKPYIIENEKLKIYSTEELCFFITHRIYDIDNTIINRKLVVWLEEEIGAVRTANILNQQISAKAPITKMLELILTEFDYISKDEIHKIVLNKTLPLTPAQEAENLGNMFLQQKKYEKAIKAFRRSLRYRDQERKDNAAEAETYEKIGIAYARMFLYNEAAESFALSYMKNAHSQVHKLYNFAVQMGAAPVSGMEEENTEAKEVYDMQETKDTDRIYKDFVSCMDRIQSLKSSGMEQEYMEELDALIDKIKSELNKQLK